ncbi:MAG TPA: hypothetical protein VFN50_00900 [Acidimicrobiales bacterium]|nr:hypothetical protein [Acidimicrobiales bacterium]
MAWLLRDGQVLASLDILESARPVALRRPPEHAARLVRGSRGFSALAGPSGMDVAWLDDDLVVLALRSSGPYGLPRWRRRAAGLLEAERGAFGRWGLAVGDHLEIKE